MIELNSINYNAIGTYKITGTQNGQIVSQPLSAWAGGTSSGSLWSSVTAALNASNKDAAFHSVFITPGPVSGTNSATSGGGCQAYYYGMGAFIYGINDAAALISPNMNGAAGSDFGVPMPFRLSDILYSYIGDGFSIGDNSGPIMTLGSSTFSNSLASTLYVSGNISLGTFGAEIGNIENSTSNGNVAVDQQTQGLLATAIGLVQSNPFSLTTGTGIGMTLQLNGNLLPMKPGSVNWDQAVSDPVNAVTGEFYVDTVDLKLNGPMPLEIRRIYTSQNPFSGAFGYGWKISMVPYLVVSQDSNQTLIYAAEKDGSVMTYRRQTSPNTRWIVTGTDNPQYTNSAPDHPGSPGNLLNNYIDESVSTSGTTFTLTGADGSVRTFLVESFPTSGTNGLTRTRPYLQQWQDNRGNYFTFSYGSDPTQVNYGQLTKIQSSNGNYAGFMYDTYGHITQAFTGDGSWTIYQYDNYGDLTQVTLTDSSIINYSYRHQLQANTTNQYYSEHLLTEEDKPGGRVLKNQYDNFGFRRVLSQQSTVQQNSPVLIQSATFSYSITGIPNNLPVVLSGTTYSAGTGLSLTGGLNSSTLISGNINLTGTALFSGTTPLPTSLLFSGSTTITDVNGNNTIYSFSNSQITQINSPPQNNGTTRQTITQVWNPPTSGTTNGVYPCTLQSRIDKRNLVTNYIYDTQGNLATVTLSGSLTGLPGTQTATTNMAYNNSLPVTLPGSGLTTIPNTLASVTDANGNSVNYLYGDTAHPYLPTSTSKGTSIGTPHGTVSTTVLKYQNVGGACGLLQQETIAISSSDQAITIYTNNSNGFPTTKKQFTGTSDPDITASYTYNLRGELTSVTDAAGRNTIYTYDARGNQAGILRYDESGNLVSWQFSYYNQNGEIEWTQGPRYAPDDIVQKEYDRAGRLAMVSKSLIKANSSGQGVVGNGYATTFYSYDNFGNLTQILDPNLNTTTMTYDAVGEMLTRQTPNPTNSANPANESFTYEAGGKVATHTTVLGGIETNLYTSTGLLISGSKADGSSKSYQYDLTGRVVKEIINNSSYWLTSYDDYGRTITRNYYSSNGTLLTTQPEVQGFDRRGNLILKVDLKGNSFTTTYDALNRIKTSTGPTGGTPSGTGSTAQQSVYHKYDSAGITEIITNGLGEQSVTTFDALKRPTLVSLYNSDGTVSINTSYVYSPNNQSVTTIVGSGASGGPNGASVSNTIYTDTFGKQILLVHGDGSFQKTVYDANENKVLFQDEMNAQSSWSYDSLNHPLSETLPVSSGSAAITYFQYNAAGELLSRQMPESLTATTNFNSAGQKTSEALIGAGGTTTRQFYYTYYTSGSDTGLLCTGTDPRGFTVTTTYDAWLRPYSVNSSGASIARQNQNTTYGYDPRGLITSINQSDALGSNSTSVIRSYDTYGKINQETVSVSGTVISEWNQSWDSAGRRSALNFQLQAFNGGNGQASQYAYTYNASGLMTSVANLGNTYSYTYTDNGLISQRINSQGDTEVITRDNRGRISHQGSNWYLISETMTYRFDSKLTSYNVAGSMVTSESRNYNNYDGRGRLTVEPCLYPGTGILSGSLNANFEFDESSGVNNEGGLGVRTRESILAKSGTAYGVKTITQNGLSQVTQEFNSQTNLPVSGSTNIIYDSAGNVTSKYSTTTSGTQTLTWDAWGRLAKVSMRNSGTNDYDWTTVYDGLGRRVLTVQQPMNNGTNSTSSTYLNYYYDPQVEFLELGINSNGGRAWRVYGPDLSGRYGGAQGIGGIEAVVDETSGTVIAQTKDIFGNTVGGYINIFTTIPYSKTYAGYGPAFGTFLDYSKNGYPTPEWRGRYPDSTGFICMGGRYYDYQGQSGRFLSADPYGHAASMDLYSYCNGDSINRIDPTGRCSNDQPVDLTLSGVVPTTDSDKRMQYYWNNKVGDTPFPGSLGDTANMVGSLTNNSFAPQGLNGPVNFNISEGMVPRQNWNINVYATVFSGGNDPTDTDPPAFLNRPITPNQLAAALPGGAELRGRYIEVYYDYTGQSVIVPVLDLGPFYNGTPLAPADRYWNYGTPPLAEETHPLNVYNDEGQVVDHGNAAGIDLSPQVWRFYGFGISTFKSGEPYVNTKGRDDNPVINWRFVPRPN